MNGAVNTFKAIYDTQVTLEDISVVYGKAMLLVSMKGCVEQSNDADQLHRLCINTQMKLTCKTSAGVRPDMPCTKTAHRPLVSSLSLSPANWTLFCLSRLAVINTSEVQPITRLVAIL